jgi:nucleotide-binding universal stress UspA family protein
MTSMRKDHTEEQMRTMQRLDLRHVVSPVDLSGQFRSSLQYAMAIARARNAELRTLHVVPTEGPAHTRGLGSLTRDSLMQRLRESIAQADPAHDLVGGAVRKGDPATQILHYARAMRADLIVLGAPGADRPERPVGPVASVVIARSDCPVLAVPAHPAGSSSESGVFSRIVCGIDSAPSSAGVIRQALSLAWETGGRLTYVCATPEGDSASLSQLRRRLLAAVPSEARGWCEVDLVVRKGAPNLEIVRLAAEQGADLVVVGAPRRWTSTTHAVLSHSLCPVLVTHDAQPLPWPAVRLAQESVAMAGINRSRR